MSEIVKQEDLLACLPKVVDALMRGNSVEIKINKSGILLLEVNRKVICKD